MVKEYKFVSAVIYIHNQQKNIQTYLGLVHSFLREHFIKYEVICVDDASSDESVKRIHELVEKEKLDNVSLISMSVFHGRELGMESGVDLSIGDYVYEFEWIDMFDPETYADKLWRAYEEAISGYDIVTYSSSRYKGLGSVLFYKLYNRSNRSYMELTPERFRIVTRRAINRVSRMNKAIVYRKALYANSGLKVKDIGDKKPEKSFKNKNVIRNKSKMGVNVLLAYTGLIPKIAFVIECVLLVLFCCSFFYLGFSQQPMTNKLHLFVISLAAALLGAIGLIIVKYCEHLLELVLKKEKYLFSSVEKLVNSKENK